VYLAAQTHLPADIVLLFVPKPLVQPQLSPHIPETGIILQPIFKNRFLDYQG
jgi:hypothetical protein